MFEDGTIVGKITDIENYGSCDIVFVDSNVYHNLSFANTGDIFLEIKENESKVVLNKEKFMQTKVCDEDGE